PRIAAPSPPPPAPGPPPAVAVPPSSTPPPAATPVPSRHARARPVCRSGRREGDWHIVGEGESLWSIAERYYDDGNRYPRILRANRDRIDDPDVILPCQRLRVPR
ncbi:MAG TPA: LysM peptidoglycan-binding domain-containing protein, partial [Hyphomicrobiaceae bacterium]|nr:LysM peptidoglycan-binding domain-containing protein [Hyphomicrobiaceae bacterium]